MPENISPARQAFGDIAPTLARYTDDVLFGDVWARSRPLAAGPKLDHRGEFGLPVSNERAAIPFEKAIENGVTRKEVIELITHLAFYSGWPTASSAVTIARAVFAELDDK